MDKSYQKPLFIVLIILALAVGTFLYMGTYFSGLLFILASVVLYGVFRWLQSGKEGFFEDVRSAVRGLMVPVIGIVAAIIIGAVIMILSGYNPIAAYRALFYG